MYFLSKFEYTLSISFVVLWIHDVLKAFLHFHDGIDP